MNTQKRTLRALEWDNIVKKLSLLAMSEPGKERALELELLTDFSDIKNAIMQTSEAKSLLDRELLPDFSEFFKIKEALNLIRAGYSLNSEELLKVAKNLRTSRRIKSFLAKYKDLSILLNQIAIDLYENRELEDSIINIFDDNGNMLDNASHELKSLRMSIRDQLANLKARLNSLLNAPGFSKYLQEPVFTIRDERYVFPIKIEYKSNVPGIVHDSSSSGATLYIEPTAIIPLNNAIRETEIKIETEIKRILAELSAKINEFSKEIDETSVVLAELDFIFAKARYSILLKAVEPDLNRDKFVVLKGAKHPILLTLIDKVVPNDVEIGKNFNSLIITGSNTGGKTVVLKTIGLCVLMTRAGLHVPAYSANIYPYSKVFADIGDEQSLVQNLSTFSGHMTNIIGIINEANENSLVLMDEVGAGTDPSEGSALARAILEELSAKNINTIATTHYGELKTMAYKSKKFYNASVEFDLETLSPTYKLLMGIPGRSNALTIAKNLGMTDRVINLASEIYNSEKGEADELLEEIQNTQQELSKNAEKIETTKNELEKLETEYTENIDKLRLEKKSTINVYKKKFDNQVNNAKSEIKELLEEVRRTKSEKIARRAINRINELEAGFRKGTAEEVEALEPKYDALDWNNIKIGDKIYIKDLEQEAELLSMPDKSGLVQIQLGLLKTSVKKNRIAKFDPNKMKSSSKVYKSPYGKKNYSFSREVISNKLDLRGMNTDDALYKLDKYLDDANLANLTPVYIIHGHGTGVLRRNVREYLTRSPYVREIRAGENSEGGDGITVVDLV
ncbi:MAG: endonuclease MutS2 [bacterium]